jgi:P-type E1-E2 ATPase
MLTLFSDNGSECWNVIYCVVAISVFGQGAINIFHDQKLKQASDSVNKQTCDKFVFNRRQKRFVKRQWDDLHVGDIIKIKNNNLVPADCLILDIKSNI